VVRGSWLDISFPRSNKHMILVRFTVGFLYNDMITGWKQFKVTSCFFAPKLFYEMMKFVFLKKGV